jgi:tRNA threonylcarbamoyl adenosine modification protein YeaZ
MNGAGTIVVETSTPQGSVGLWQGSWRERSFVSERSHNCAIFPPLEELLGAAEEFRMDLILVGTGPGSYSGTRVGIAVAQGLAIAHGATLVGLPSIMATPSARNTGHCRAIGDARRGDWWWCDIVSGVSAQPPRMGSKAELEALLRDGVPVFSLDPVADEEFAREVPQEIPSAGRLWEAWQAFTPEQQEHFAAQVVQPVYLKPPHITMPKSGHPLLR